MDAWRQRFSEVYGGFSRQLSADAQAALAKGQDSYRVWLDRLDQTYRPAFNLVVGLLNQMPGEPETGEEREMAHVHVHVSNPISFRPTINVPEAAVTVEPAAPQITVNTPKLKRSIKRPVRDDDGEIVRVEEEHEYHKD